MVRFSTASVLDDRRKKLLERARERYPENPGPGRYGDAALSHSAHRSAPVVCFSLAENNQERYKTLILNEHPGKLSIKL